MTEPIHASPAHQCPHCNAVIDEAYIEINPFPQIPCPSCNALISSDSLSADKLSEQDKRADHRCPVSLKVSYRSYNEFIEEYTKNVSKMGMFIHSTRPHTIGETVEVMLNVPGLDDPVSIIGEVRHVKTDAANEENRGIGLKFINIDEQSRQALINYIRSQGNCI